jgi:hypothetical protein
VALIDNFVDEWELGIVVIPEECPYCGALKWAGESLDCCFNSGLHIDPSQELLALLRQLFDRPYPDCKHFSENIVEDNGLRDVTDLINQDYECAYFEELEG